MLLSAVTCPMAVSRFDSCFSALPGKHLLDCWHEIGKAYQGCCGRRFKCLSRHPLIPMNRIEVRGVMDVVFRKTESRDEMCWALFIVFEHLSTCSLV